MHRNPFSDAEIEGRIDRFRTVLVERGLDAAILSSPENVFYFTGLDHTIRVEVFTRIDPNVGRQVGMAVVDPGIDNPHPLHRQRSRLPFRRGVLKFVRVREHGLRQRSWSFQACCWNNIWRHEESLSL